MGLSVAETDDVRSIPVTTFGIAVAGESPGLRLVLRG